MALVSTRNLVRFGQFELDLDARELRKNGLKIRLPQKPLHLLSVLLERPGEVFTREELRSRLWASGVFIDFDHGLNKSIQKLRESLGDSAESPRYVETLQRLGYRFIAPVNGAVLPTESPALEEERVEEPVAEAPPPEQPADLPPRSRHWGSAWIIAIAALLISSVAAWLILKHRPPTGKAIHSLAVLPLENLSGDPSQEYFADGMTDELITELAHIPNLRVVSRTSIMQDKGFHKPLSQLAHELSVDAVVEGSVVRLGDRVRITAQLIDASNDKHLWAQSFEGQTNDILLLEDNVAREIAAQTEFALSQPASADRKGAVRISPAAHDAYLRGRYFLNKREADKSAVYFQQAITLDPAYASAYAGLADSFESQTLLQMAKADDAMPKGLAAAKRAIVLDPENGEAYSSLGSIETTYEWNWVAAEQNLTRSIALSPSYSYGEMRYAVYLDAMNRPQEAINHMRRALQLDPLSFLMNRHLGSTLFFARQYDEALYHLRRAAEMEPHAHVVENWVSWIYEKEGMRDEAVDHDLAWLHEGLSPAGIENLRSIYRRAGWKAYWQARIDGMSPHAQQGCTPYFLGVSYLRMGNRNQAFFWLNRAIDQRCFWLVWLKVDPLVDDLRADDRFAKLLQRMNLPE